MGILTISYAGRRISNGKKYVHCYIDQDGTELRFVNKLNVLNFIGDIMDVDEVREGSYKFIKTIGQVDKAKYQKYSIGEAAATQYMAELKASKIKSDAHIDVLIEAVKKANYADRRRIALYIYTKLMNG